MASGVQYLALLRGINVGGKNLIKMADLREAFEDIGVLDVATFIASGNVFFRAPRQPRAALAAKLESKLSRRFATDLKVVLLTEAELRGVVEGAPPRFGWDTHRCDVIFLRKPLTTARAFGVVETKEGVDQAWKGRGVLYFARLAARASSSRLGKITALPEYKNLTIRSWSTTTKLLEQLDARSDGGTG
jgi:uncharacterized protein (DUF1697 family)